MKMKMKKSKMRNLRTLIMKMEITKMKIARTRNLLT